MTPRAADILRAVEAGEMTNEEIAREFDVHPDHISRLKRSARPGGGSAVAATWTSVKHGAWKGLGPEIDKRVRTLLDRGDSIGEIAGNLGVAEGYVRAIATEDDERPPPDLKPAPALPPSESPSALSRVACVVESGAEIGARECVARQCESKCFCPKAAFAINAIAPHALPGTRLEDQLAQCRAFVRSVIGSSERYFGPARDARDGKPVTLPLVSPVPLPAPPAKAEPSLVERAQAKRAREQEIERKIEESLPPRPTLAQTYREAHASRGLADAQSIEGGGVKAARSLPPRTAANASPPSINEVAAAVLAQRKLIPEAKEEAMQRRYEMVPCKAPGCTTPIALTRNKTGLCAKHRQAAAKGQGPTTPSPRIAKPTRSARPVPSRPDPACVEPAAPRPHPPTPLAISEVLAGVQHAIAAIEALPLSAQQFVLNLVNESRIAQLTAKQLPAHHD